MLKKAVMRAGQLGQVRRLFGGARGAEEALRAGAHEEGAQWLKEFSQLLVLESFPQKVLLDSKPVLQALSQKVETMDVKDLKAVASYARILKKQQQEEFLGVEEQTLKKMSNRLSILLKNTEQPPLQVIDLYHCMLSLGLRTPAWQALFTEQLSQPLSKDMFKYMAECLHQTGRQLNREDINVMRELKKHLRSMMPQLAPSEMADLFLYASSMQKYKMQWMDECIMLAKALLREAASLDEHALLQVLKAHSQLPAYFSRELLGLLQHNIYDSFRKDPSQFSHLFLLEYLDRHSFLLPHFRQTSKEQLLISGLLPLQQDYSQQQLKKFVRIAECYQNIDLEQALVDLLPSLESSPPALLLMLARRKWPIKEAFLKERERVKLLPSGHSRRLLYDYLLARYCNLAGGEQSVGALEQELLHQLVQVFFCPSMVPPPPKQLSRLRLSGPVVEPLKQALGRQSLDIASYSPTNVLLLLRGTLLLVDQHSFSATLSFLDTHLQQLNSLLGNDKDVACTLALHLQNLSEEQLNDHQLSLCLHLSGKTSSLLSLNQIIFVLSQRPQILLPLSQNTISTLLSTIQIHLPSCQSDMMNYIFDVVCQVIHNNKESNNPFLQQRNFNIIHHILKTYVEKVGVPTKMVFRQEMEHLLDYEVLSGEEILFCLHQLQNDTKKQSRFKELKQLSTEQQLLWALFKDPELYPAQQYLIDSSWQKLASRLLQQLSKKYSNNVKGRLLHVLLKVPVQFYSDHVSQVMDLFSSFTSEANTSQFVHMAENLSPVPFSSAPNHFYQLQNILFQKLGQEATQEITKLQFVRLLEAFRKNQLQVRYLKKVVSLLPGHFKKLSLYERFRVLQLLAFLRIGQSDIMLPLVESLHKDGFITHRRGDHLAYTLYQINLASPLFDSLLFSNALSLSPPASLYRLGLYAALQDSPQHKAFLLSLLSHPALPKDIAQVAARQQGPHALDVYNLLDYLQLTFPQESSSLPWLAECASQLSMRAGGEYSDFLKEVGDVLGGRDEGWSREEKRGGGSLGCWLSHPQRQVAVVVVSHQELNVDRTTLSGRTALALKAFQAGLPGWKVSVINKFMYSSLKDSQAQKEYLLSLGV